MNDRIPMFHPAQSLYILIANNWMISFFCRGGNRFLQLRVKSLFSHTLRNLKETDSVLYTQTNCIEHELPCLFTFEGKFFSFFFVEETVVERSRHSHSTEVL